MTILNKDALPKWHGPYINLVYRKKPLKVNKGAWPHPREYNKDIFFDLSDDLLGAFCGLTKTYSPFDPWELTILSNSSALKKVENTFKQWVKTIGSLESKALYKRGKYLYRTTGQGRAPAPRIIRSDLLETLNFLIEQFHKARLNGHAIAIIGI
ncbi:MAG: hypothetical protein BWY09_02281 [Candidatus Hydrogenedentes bacterium ADurb.Bin179]|nr:MAG: hypothetical protein BWY09_02281 [Candidatus Hydrogenedentes bacterium ADurb.Bin179]